MARIRGNTVILKGDPLQDTAKVNVEIASTDGQQAGAARDVKVYPGMLLAYQQAVARGGSTRGHEGGTIPHNAEKGDWHGSVADFRDYVGDGLGTPYDSGDTIQTIYPHSGHVLRGLHKISAAALKLAVGDALVSDGSGGLQKASDATNSATIATVRDNLKERANIVGWIDAVVDVPANAAGDLVVGTQKYVYVQWRVK